MSEGYIYLRRQTGHGYCFGKTNDIARRDREYRKENPFLKNVSVFHTFDMDAAESHLAAITKRLRIFSNSREWIAESNESVQLFEQARRRYEGKTFAQVMQEDMARRAKKQKAAEEKAFVAESRKKLSLNQARLAGIPTRAEEINREIAKKKAEIAEAESRFQESWGLFSAQLCGLPVKLSSAAFLGFVFGCIHPIAGAVVASLVFLFGESPSVTAYKAKRAAYARIPIVRSQIASLQECLSGLAEEEKELKLKISAAQKKAG